MAGDAKTGKSKIAGDATGTGLLRDESDLLRRRGISDHDLRALLWVCWSSRSRSTEMECDRAMRKETGAGGVMAPAPI